MNGEKPGVRGLLIDALSQSPMLKYLGQYGSRGGDLRAMLQTAEVHEFSAGDAIIIQGDESAAMYLLVSGAVSISLNGADVCTMDRPGEVFGEFGAMTGELRSASVTAQTGVVCLAVRTPSSAGQLSDESASFYGVLQQAFAKILLVRLQQSNEEKVRLTKALTTTENLAGLLRIDNEMLTQELQAAREQLREGHHGTRGGAKA